VLGCVRQLGGHVSIESLLGSGTIVTVFLPRVPC
jgi:signal transduction histidine kinase